MMVRSMLNKIKGFINRIISPTPEYFRRMRERAIAYGATAMAIKGMQEIGLGSMPDWMGDLFTYAVMISIGIVGTTSLMTIKDSTKSDNGEEKEEQTSREGKE